MKLLNQSFYRIPQRGFNLVEVLLAVSFFALAFSGMLLGSTAMVHSTTSGIKATEDMSVVGNLFAGLNPNSAYLELSPTQAAAVGTTATVAANISGDITTRQTIILPDNTANTADNRRVIYDRLVYSLRDTPDVKTAQINIYDTMTSTTPRKSIVRKLDRRNECYAMGVQGTFYFGTEAKKCTGWAWGNNVPQFRPLTITGNGGQQNFIQDFRVSGANAAQVNANQLGLFEVVSGAVPVLPTDRGHRFAQSEELEYYLEGSPNTAYNITVGLRKMTGSHKYVVRLNSAWGTAPVDCGVIPRPSNCQRENIVLTPQDLQDVNNNDPFSVKFVNVLPFSLGTSHFFRITVESTNDPTGVNPVIVHYIDKKVATR
jgi:hypothetical protein